MKPKVKVVLILMIIIVTTLLVLYKEYREAYEVCNRYSYIYPADCSVEISFQEFQRQYSFLKVIFSYLNPKRIGELFGILMFSRYSYLAAILIVIIIFWKSDNSNRDTSSKKDKEGIKLFLGLFPFLFMIIHGMINFYHGFTFLFSHSYGWDAFLGTVVADFLIFLPINIVAIALVVSAIANKKVKKIISNEESVDEQQN